MQNIRPFAVHDLEILLTLDKLSYRHELQFTKENLLEILRSENTLCYLYQKEEADQIKVIGSLIIKMNFIKRTLILISVVVHPDYRRQQCGKEQLDFIIALSRYLKFDKIVLQIEKDNHRGIAFFERASFRITDWFDDFIVPGLAGLEMQLEL